MTVTNPYYEFAPEFIPGTKARSDDVNLQYQAIQNAFDFLPGAADAITTGTSTFAPESGTGNAYVVTMPDTRTAENDGDEVIFFAAHTNTAAATLEVDGLGAKSIVRADGTAVVSGDLASGILYVMRYDASNTRYQLIGPSTSYLTAVTAAAAAAAISETNAATSESLAQEWADNAIDVAITGNPGLYSARHWADGAAQAWAINAEDSLIGTTFGGDAATTYSAYHWAQKAIGAATIQTIVADIPTASPPTTEAVTALLQYEDSDSTDDLAFLGFSGSSILRLRNQMHGSAIQLEGEDNAGTLRTIFSGDPDGNTVVTGDTGVELTVTPSSVRMFYGQSNGIASVYYNGSVRLQTSNLGIGVRTASNIPPSTGGNQDAQILFENAGGSNTAIVGFTGATDFYITNKVHGGGVVLTAENGTGIEQTLFEGDPDGAVGLRYNNISVAETLTAAGGGLQVNNTLTGAGFERVLTASDLFTGATPINLVGSINTATPPTTELVSALLQYKDADSTDDLGYVGFNGQSNLYVANQMHGGQLYLTGQDDAGSTRTLFRGDPDAITYVQGATQVLLSAASTTCLLASASNTNIYAAGVSVFSTTPAASGGVLVNNTLTGTGVERVLTVSDLTGSALVPASAGTDTPLVSDGAGGWAEQAALTIEDIASDVWMWTTTLGGDIYLQSGDPGTTGEALASFLQGDACILHFNDVHRLATTALGIRTNGSTGNDPSAGGVQSAKLEFRNSGIPEIGAIYWPASVDMYLQNAVHGGDIYLTAQDGAGTEQNLFWGDPAAAATLYYAGVAKLATTATGIDTNAIIAETLFVESTTGSTGIKIQKRNVTDQGFVQYNNEAGVERWNIGMVADTTDDLYIGRFNDSGVFQESSISIDGGTGVVTIPNGIDVPDNTELVFGTGSDVALDFDATDFNVAGPGGTSEFNASGFLEYNLSAIGNTSTETQQIKFLQLDGTLKARIGYETPSAAVIIRNYQHGSQIALHGEDDAGTFKVMFLCDPDGANYLYYDGSGVAETATAANGGLLVNNTSTGAGLERVLTESDIEETGTFNIQLTGFTTPPSVTSFSYTKQGNMVTIQANSAKFGTSNATTMTGTGLPAALTPVGTASGVFGIRDNGTDAFGEISVSGTTLTFYAGVGGAAFTNSGSKGILSYTFAYELTG